jgi:hypothetical protein
MILAFLIVASALCYIVRRHYKLQKSVISQTKLKIKQNFTTAFPDDRPDINTWFKYIHSQF